MAFKASIRFANFTAHTQRHTHIDTLKQDFVY